jgi:hypothetical protein
MTEHQPLWVRVLFSLVPLAMGLIILGAWFGIIPTDGGTFHAPPVVILSLAGILILFALLVWLPSQAPKSVRLVLPAVLLLLVAVVCNWTAFAPGVRYSSQVSIGPWSSTGEDQVGGRIVFALVALAIDALLALALFQAIRKRSRPK